jgi:hypothetical protein
VITTGPPSRTSTLISEGRPPVVFSWSGAF